jgi:hypothetical protein
MLSNSANATRVNTSDGHYIEEIGQSDHLRLVSTSEALTPTFIHLGV